MQYEVENTCFMVVRVKYDRSNSAYELAGNRNRLAHAAAQGANFYARRGAGQLASQLAPALSLPSC